MNMLFLSLAFSAVFLGSACAAYRSGSQSGGRLTGFFVGGFLATLFSAALSPPLLFNVLLLVVLGIICRGVKASPRRFAWTAAAGTLLVYVGYSATHVPTFLEWQRIRERNPVESLAARLEYEERAIARRATTTDSAVEAATEVANASVAAAPNFERRLDALEESLDDEWRWRSRSSALRTIHSSYVQQFIDSPGFGVVRGGWLLTPERFADAPEPRVIQLPPGEFCDPDGTPSGGAAPHEATDSNDPPAPPPVAARQLEMLHEEGLFDFINRRGWGYVRDREHVAGFQPHQFRQPPVVPAANSVEQQPKDVFERRRWQETSDQSSEPRDADQHWQIRKLQLVSLLKHAEPSVYVTDELPRMDRLNDVPVRPLDAFERSSLRSLEQGEDVVSDSSNVNRIQMLGAIRAAKQCLNCHSVERGELLGAFSYVLERTVIVREPHRPLEPAF
jgi:hypothetical protein